MATLGLLRALLEAFLLYDRLLVLLICLLSLSLVLVLSCALDVFDRVNLNLPANRGLLLILANFYIYLPLVESVVRWGQWLTLVYEGLLLCVGELLSDSRSELSLPLSFEVSRFFLLLDYFQMLLVFLYLKPHFDYVILSCNFFINPLHPQFYLAL